MQTPGTSPPPGEHAQQIEVFASADSMGQIEHSQLAGKTVDVTVAIQGQPVRMAGRFEDVMRTLETERNQAVQRRNDAPWPEAMKPPPMLHGRTCASLRRKSAK